MKRPTQSVFIVENDTAYAFDAVIKSEATTSNKVAEDAKDVSGKAHVNYAMKSPTTIQMEVSVSDTVSVSDEPLTKGADIRSITAYRTINAMCERRNLLTVITPKYTYSKMIIESVSLVESTEYQNEAHMNITFKEMIVEKKKTSGGNTQTKTEKPAEEETTQPPSVLQSLLSWFTGKVSGNSGK